MKGRTYFVIFALLIVLGMSPSLFGQATGSFSGNVTDKSGAAIVGAAVTATSQGTGVSRQVNSDEAGHYLIQLLPIGVYTLRVDFKGFQPVESKDLKLQVDESRELDFTLALSSVSSTVEVSAAAVA